jgi:hypothetical protein
MVIPCGAVLRVVMRGAGCDDEFLSPLTLERNLLTFTCLVVWWLHFKKRPGRDGGEEMRGDEEMPRPHEREATAPRPEPKPL